MENINPFGESGLMFAGIGQVIVVLAITLFIQIKKRDPKIPLEVPLLIVGLHT
jgi:hypothetical protein